MQTTEVSSSSFYSISRKKISKVSPYFLSYHAISKQCTVKEGDRIAQLILEKIYTPEVQEVEVSDLLMSTNWKIIVIESRRNYPWCRRFWLYGRLLVPA